MDANGFSPNNVTEEDAKRLNITPALHDKWDPNKIRNEYRITDGAVVIGKKGNKRRSPLFADYVLFSSTNYPIAVVEAKKSTRPLADGIQQAIDYAKKLDAPFAYSTNGNAFLEHDFLTGKEREFAMDEFPTEAELIARQNAELNNGAGITELQLRLRGQQYCAQNNSNSPRYYQRVAINRTLDRIALGDKRLLLVMATGTGKTYTAFQIVWRLIKSNVKSRILYLADRNILVDQSIQQDFRPLESVVHKVEVAKETKAKVTSYQVYFALYQQLIGDDEKEHYSELFSPDFFDVVIVDECHRGSAKRDSRWRRILDYFSSAVHIGMTATPKETDEVSNLDYFGEPVYQYSLQDGISDGFLAPFRVINYALDIGQGWRPAPGQKDAFGNIIEDREYDNKDFDYNIVLEDRVVEVAKIITRYLKATDRYQKTIVFCADQDAAGRMRKELINLNADIVCEHEDYIVRITGNDDVGKKKLDYFISVAEKFPTIATTSQLLSTGVDCKMTKLIVLDKQIESMTEFKQIIGRGTRLRFDDGKSSFVVLDFRNVTKLFRDSDWDGPVEQAEGFDADEPEETLEPSDKTKKDADQDKGPKLKPFVDRAGCTVALLGEQHYIFDVKTGRPIPENVIDYAKRNIVGEFRTLENFIKTWREHPKKEEIRDLFLNWGVDIQDLKESEGMNDVDDFDFVCHIAFDQKALTRKERAAKVRKSDIFTKYGEVAREILNALLDRYAENGVYEIEDNNVFKLEPFIKYGKLVKIVKEFGGKNEFYKALELLESELYNDNGAAV